MTRLSDSELLSASERLHTFLHQRGFDESLVRKHAPKDIALTGIILDVERDGRQFQLVLDPDEEPGTIEKTYERDSEISLRQVLTDDHHLNCEAIYLEMVEWLGPADLT